MRPNPNAILQTLLEKPCSMIRRFFRNRCLDLHNPLHLPKPQYHRKSFPSFRRASAFPLLCLPPSRISSTSTSRVSYYITAFLEENSSLAVRISPMRKLPMKIQKKTSLRSKGGRFPKYLYPMLDSTREGGHDTIKRWLSVHRDFRTSEGKCVRKGGTFLLDVTAEKAGIVTF